MDRQAIYRNKPEVKARRRAYNKQRERNNRAEALKVFGDKCCLCGYPDSAMKIALHEIHGRKHNGCVRYALAHREDFVPLCRADHSAVHRFMMLFGLEWKDILELKEKFGRTLAA